MKSPTAAGRPLKSGSGAIQLHPGLSSLLRRRQLRRVSRDGIPFGASSAVRSLRVLPSGLDVELCYAVDIAASRHCPLVAVLPLPLPAAPMAMAAAATISAIAAAERVRARTAVVSPRLAGRQVYEDLLVGREQLSVLVPRTMAGEGCGENTVVTAHDCAQLLSLESLDALTGLVLDLSAVSLGDLDRVLRHLRHRSARRPLRLLAITASPLDPAVGMIRQANGLVYAVDQAALAGQASVTPEPGPGDGLPLVCGAGDLVRAAGAPLELHDCGDVALDNAVSSLWAATANLSRKRGTAGNTAQVGDLRWAWAVTSSFTQLATSAARADYHADRRPWAPPSLLEAPQRARDLAVRENEALWLRWAEAADAAVAASSREHKAAVIAQVAAELAAEDRPVLVLARNRVAAAALRSALLENPVAPAEVSVASMRDFAASRLRIAGDALVVIPGPLPRPYAGWLAVPPSRGLLMLAAGPLQTLRAARQVIDARSALGQARISTMASSLVPDVVWTPPNLHIEMPPPGETLAVITGVGTHMPFEALGGQWDDRARRSLEARALQADPAGLPGNAAEDAPLWTPFRDDALAALERCAGLPAGAADQILENDADGSAGTGGGVSVTSSWIPVPVVPLTLRPLDGGDEFVLLQPPGETLTRRDGLQVKAVAARSLRPGDLVALVDGQARQDLFGHIVDTLEESPDWGLQVALARFWHKCVRRIPGSGLTYEEIRWRSGVSVQAKTIGTWARGQAECPLDPEDVRRLAGFLEDDDVLSRADAVAAALRALWQLHRKAGRWLSARLADASRAGLGDDAIRGRARDEVLDPALGLRASDLLGAIRLCRVTATGTTCSAPAGATGSPLSPTQAAALCVPLADAADRPALPGPGRPPETVADGIAAVTGISARAEAQSGCVSPPGTTVSSKHEKPAPQLPITSSGAGEDLRTCPRPPGQPHTEERSSSCDE